MSYPEPPGGPNPYPRDIMREPVESQYPPPPGEEDERHPRAYHHRVPSSNSMSLPSLSPYGVAHYPPQQPAQHNDYPPPPTDVRPYNREPYAQVHPNPYREERNYPQEYNRGGQQPQAQMAFTQSAPRQRTAIACRYCRRRKIRCSGFDQNPEGRCSNCQRFQQECIFTPVSSQAQAFVPAHAVYPHMRGVAVGPDGRARQAYPGQQAPAQIYGAHGQPLGPLPPQQTLQHPTHPQQAPSPYSEYPIPSPTGSYSDENQLSRKRPQPEPHQQILPPPMPGQPYPPRAHENGTRRQPAEAQAQDDRHHHLPPLTPTSQDSRVLPPQPQSNYSPGSSTSSNNGSLHPPPGHGISMSRTPPPRSSPVGDNSVNGRQDPMSLRSIVDSKRPDMDIDRKMLGRLDRKN